MGTDRSRIAGLYAVTDTPPHGRLEDVVEAVLRGGASIVQYRDKGSDRVRRSAEARALRTLCREYDAVFLINDDVDLARSVGADGVHLGQGDAAIEEAREKLGPDAFIGASCYADPDRAVRAQRAGADYLAFGAVYASATKPHAARAPLSLFETERHHGVPLVAIGGIDASGAADLASAGADAIAVVRALFAARDPEHAAREIVQQFRVGQGH